MTREVELAKLSLSLSSMGTTYMLSLLFGIYIPPSQPLSLFHPQKRKETAVSVSGKVPDWYVRSLGGCSTCARARTHTHGTVHGDIRAHCFSMISVTRYLVSKCYLTGSEAREAAPRTTRCSDTQCTQQGRGCESQCINFIYSSEAS